MSLLFISLSLHAKKSPFYTHFFEKVETSEGLLLEEAQGPWFTGPLLAPSALVVPAGHYNIEPYIYIVADTGKYNGDWKAVKSENVFWNNYFQPSLQFGLTQWMDFSFNPTLVYNFTDGAAKWGIGDMPVGIDFQLWKRGKKVTDWISALKLAIREVFPLGKYQNLKPSKLGTDVGGGGSWQTAAGIVWGNLFHLGNNRFLASRLSLQYNLPAPVHVKNLNAYGGAKGTRGTVYPAQSFTLDTSIELNLTKNWVFACDFVGNWAGNTRFKGHATAKNSEPTSAQFSIAPAIEYNWNVNIGIIFGSWFTIAGRNAPQFYSGVFAFNYYH